MTNSLLRTLLSLDLFDQDEIEAGIAQLHQAFPEHHHQNIPSVLHHKSPIGKQVPSLRIDSSGQRHGFNEGKVDRHLERRLVCFLYGQDIGCCIRKHSNKKSRQKSMTKKYPRGFRFKSMRKSVRFY